MREVAGPDSRRTGTDADIDFDIDVGTLHVAGDGCFIKTRYGLTVARDIDAADADCQPVAISRFARLPDRHDDAAPIGVFTRNRGFDER